jgi:hypothetical protein
MPIMHNDDETNWEWRNGKKILRDGGRTRVSLRDAARSRTGLITDGFGNVEFHKPGFRYADTSNHIRNRDANIDFVDVAETKRRAYMDYQNDKENSWRNPGGDVGSGSHWPASPSTGPAPAGATGSRPRDEGPEQSSFDPIEDKLSEIREALRAHGYGAEEIQDFVDCINDEDDDAILRSSVQARLREFEMKRGHSTPRQQTDSAASIRDRQQAHQQRMDKIYRDIELEIGSAWRTPARPTSNAT